MKFLRKPFVYTYNNVVLYIIGINILFFIAQNILDRPPFNPWFTWALALNVNDVLQRGQVWAFVTYMFAHGGFQHLLFNMIGLFFFGTAVERRVGSSEFLLFYFTTGILAGLTSFFVYLIGGAANVQLLGASGAVYAILLAYAVFFPDSRIYIWGILPIRAPLLVGFYILSTLYFLIGGRGGGVAHLTHFAGLVFAWIWFPVRYGYNPLHSFIGRGR